MIRWTNEQIQFLMDNYGKVPSSQIANKLGIPQKTVIYKATRIGLRSNLRRKSSSIHEKIKYSGLRPLDEIVKTHDSIRFECGYCKSIFITTPDRVGRGHTKSCGCRHQNARKGTEHVSSSLFTRCRRLAEARNIEFNLTIGYVEDLFIAQNMRCALSGQQLVYGYGNKITMSLDRIDSSIGYIEGNVQWVHKMLNICKNTYSQQDFIEMCKTVYEHQYLRTC